MRERKERLQAEQTTKYETELKMLRYFNNCCKITTSRIADRTYSAMRDDEVDFGSERVIEDNM